MLKAQTTVLPTILAALLALAVTASAAGADTGKLTFSCGLSADAEAAANTVNVFLDTSAGAAGEQDDALVASNLTEDFRALHDVQLVYSEREADLVVTLLTMNARSASGAQVGYVATILVAYPCERTYAPAPGQSEYDELHRPFRMHLDAIMLMSSSAEELARRALARVNTDWLEDVRKEHATFRAIERALRKP